MGQEPPKEPRRDGSFHHPHEPTVWERMGCASWVVAPVVALLALLLLAGCPSSGGCLDEGERVPVGTTRATEDKSAFETCGSDGKWHRSENPDKGPSGTRA